MDNIFFYASKLIWLFVSPDSLLLLFILVSLVLFYIGKHKLAKYLLSVTSGLFLIIAFFPVGEWLLYPLESRFQANPTLPEKVDGIIVLSGAENTELSYLWNQNEINAAVERDISFIELAKNHPEAKLIFTGGTGSLLNQKFKGADVAQKLFQQLSFNSKKILFERESRNTYENVIFSKKLASPIVTENWILITTGWHMPRSVGIFCKAEWPVIPYPVDHQTKKGNIFRIDFDLATNLYYLKIGVKEWIGLVAYFFSGKTKSIFPKACK
jgi:uncharacterized SAM-binding protein YcdF (DUF218 family)